LDRTGKSCGRVKTEKRMGHSRWLLKNGIPEELFGRHRKKQGKKSGGNAIVGFLEKKRGEFFDRGGRR